MTRSHFADALVYGYSRAGKWAAVRLHYACVIAVWATWLRARPWDRYRVEMVSPRGASRSRTVRRSSARR